MMESNYNVSSDVYKELQRLLEGDGEDLRLRYGRLRELLAFVLDERTKRQNLKMVNLFARLDYLCKQTNYDMAERRRINALRIRCNRLRRDGGEVSEDLLKESFPDDCLALARLTERLYGEPVSGSLRRLLPQTYRLEEERKGQPLDVVCLRLLVEGVRGDVIECAAQDGTDERMEVAVKEENGRFGDSSYLLPLLKEGNRINVLKPRKVGSLIYGELIVYEPDYLVNVNTVAECFGPCGVTSLNVLMKKFAPWENTPYMLLGRMASQMLDEEILAAGSDRQPSYEETAEEFFKSNAMDVATCDLSKFDFHRDARSQQKIIRKVVKDRFKQAHERGGRGKEGRQDGEEIWRDLILEPSFFCEMLGLQGRVDLLSEDKSFLLEQKSGKRGWRGGHVESHYVQMLLYRAILHYNFGVGHSGMECMLFYSKYEDGLMYEGAAPGLLFKAMRARNEVVAMEKRIVKGECREMIEALVPEDFNTKGEVGILWTVYIRPRLSEQLRRLQNASEVEKLYFYRFVEFVAQEEYLEKIGTPGRIGSGMSALWNCSLSERQAAGNIIAGLRINEGSLLQADNEVGVEEIEIVDIEREGELPNFRVGDIVIFYPYPEGHEPNVTSTMVMRGTIVELHTDRLRLKLRFRQKNMGVFRLSERNVRWAIEHDVMGALTASVYRSVASLLYASPRRRELLLGLRQPEIDRDVELKGDYGSDNEVVLRAKQATDYFLLMGPPGTGKTSHGLVNILRETLRSYPDESVLLLAYTNRAVDEICGNIDRYGIDYIHLGSSASVGEAYRGHMLEERLKDCRNKDDVVREICGQRVYVSTTAAVLSRIEIFRIKRFKLAIIDEAAQILEPQILGILCAANGRDGEPAVEKFVMIGDYKQLPAVVKQAERDSQVFDKRLREIGLTDCRRSLFERLWSIQKRDGACYMLHRQGRMHEEVLEFINREFYGGELCCVPLPRQLGKLPTIRCVPSGGLERLLSQHRVIFVAVREKNADWQSKINRSEARAIAAVVKALTSLYKKSGIPFNPVESVGIIVPYRHQIACVRRELEGIGDDLVGTGGEADATKKPANPFKNIVGMFERSELPYYTAGNADKGGKKAPNLDGIMIDTVERFQGSQRDIIIYGFTLLHARQLDFLTSGAFEEDGHTIDRKLNVVLTRAREQLVLVGNPDILQSNNLFRRLINYTKVRSAYVDVALTRLVRGDFDAG